MALFVCKCLNVSLESDKLEDILDIGKLELSLTEQRDIFFSEKLLSCPAISLKTDVIQPSLIGCRIVGNYSLESCLACGQTTYAVMRERNLILIPKSLQTTPELVNNLKKSENFSPVFHLLVPEATNEIEMKENIDTNNQLFSDRNGCSPSLHLIGALKKQLNQTLESQLEAIEETVRQFKDQKYAEYEEYRVRAQRDHKILSSIINKTRSNIDTDGRTNSTLDNGPPSPLLQRRRLSSIKDAKKFTKYVKSNAQIPHEEDSLDAEDIFDLEGMDSCNYMASDNEDYDSDPASDASPPPRRALAQSPARSLPVRVPAPPPRRDAPRRDDHEETQDIAASIKALARSVHGSRYSASRQGADKPPRTATVIDDDDELYTGFNDVSPALDTRNLREDQAFQQSMRTANVGRQMPSRMGTGLFRVGTVRAGSARPVTALRAAGYCSRADAPRDERREESVEDKIKQMEAKIMTLVEESCMLAAKRSSDEENESKREQNLSQALAKAQEASTLERQLIRMQEQGNLGDSHNLDLTFAVLCNLADQYALNEMYTEALNTYQLLTRNKLFPHANRLKVNMGNIHFKMGDHPKALKLYRMALDQTPTAEKDLRMKVMHNIGLLLVRMGKFRDAVTNFQHIMQEQGDFQTGLHLVVCSVALEDAEGGQAAFHAMLDLEPPTHHYDIAIDDERSAHECVVRDVARGDRLSRWSRAAAARAERCLARAAAALQRDTDAGGTSWCVEALRGYSGGGAGARLELGSALAALRGAAGSTGVGAAAAGAKALQRLKAVARAHPDDRVLRAEANADAAFVAYALGKYSEARSLSEAVSKDDPYGCAARVSHALADLALGEVTPATPTGPGTPTDPSLLPGIAQRLTAASHLDPTDLIALHDSALALQLAGERGGAEARWRRMRGAGGPGGPGGAGATLRGLAAAGLAREARDAGDAAAAEHWYGAIGPWDVGVSLSLARLLAAAGDPGAARQHYQDAEAAWPGEAATLRGLARGAPPDLALEPARRGARLQPAKPEWGLLMGDCLRASGRYQEALAVYKKLHARFPDNIECLQLLCRLCGAQGLAEAAHWRRTLRAAASASSEGGRGQETTESTSSVTRRSAHEPQNHVSMQPIGRSVRESKKNNLEDFEDLPLPPE